ncbi:MAG: hypothetical protein Kow0090_02010 [Myxococcota bacterium]
MFTKALNYEIIDANISGWGARLFSRAEKRPIEPEPGNAGVGNLSQKKKTEQLISGFSGKHQYFFKEVLL